MKTLNLYITRNCLVTLFMSIGILTFAVVGSRLIEVFNYLARGGTLLMAGKIILCLIPYAMALAVPLGFLVTIMLIFGRLSADNEITAMRACGISILQIIAPTIIMAFILSFACLFIKLELAPVYLDKARTIARDIVSDNPLSLIEPGVQTNIAGMMIYVRERTGDDRIENIDITKISIDSDRYASQHIKARYGNIVVDKKNQKLILKLKEAQVSSYENREMQIVNMDEFNIPIDYSSKSYSAALMRSPHYLSYADIFGQMTLYQNMILQAPEVQAAYLRQQITALEVEVNNRFAMGFSPISFLLLGLPLAIRTSRRETSIGLFLATMLSLAYLVSITIIGNLDGYPQIYPQYLLWLPVFIYQALGAYLLSRIIRA